MEYEFVVLAHIAVAAVSVGVADVVDVAAVDAVDDDAVVVVGVVVELDVVGIADTVVEVMAAAGERSLAGCSWEGLEHKRTRSETAEVWHEGVA